MLLRVTSLSPHHADLQHAVPVVQPAPERRVRGVGHCLPKAEGIINTAKAIVALDKETDRHKPTSSAWNACQRGQTDDYSVLSKLHAGLSLLPPAAQPYHSATQQPASPRPRRTARHNRKPPAAPLQPPLTRKRSGTHISRLPRNCTPSSGIGGAKAEQPMEELPEGGASFPRAG